jgi:hypothetical protein
LQRHTAATRASFSRSIPTKDDAIWSIWELAKPGDRQKIAEIAKTIIGKTGTGH